MDRKLLVLVAMVLIVVLPVIWVIVSPRWVFSVTTDKTTYSLGEDVEITVRLENQGFITHSFTAGVDSPAMVDIYSRTPVPGYDLFSFGEVWFSPGEKYSYRFNITSFSLSPGEVLERRFTWNQTNTERPKEWNQTYMPGTYFLQAFIPGTTNGFTVSTVNYLFKATVLFNITSTTS